MWDKSAQVTNGAYMKVALTIFVGIEWTENIFCCVYCGKWAKQISGSVLNVTQRN